MEEYFSADRLFEVDIGSVVQVSMAESHYNFIVRLVGLDQGKLIITTLPAEHTVPDGENYETIFQLGRCLEMKVVHEGKIIAFESLVTDLVFEHSQLLIGSFPEMVECRRIRTESRYPCTLSCDVRFGGHERTGVITDISRGGCHLVISAETDNRFIEQAKQKKQPIELEIYFPFAEDPVTLDTSVKSFNAATPKGTKIGLAFDYDYPFIQKYMDSLRLESISNFFN